MELEALARHQFHRRRVNSIVEQKSVDVRNVAENFSLLLTQLRLIRDYDRAGGSSPGRLGYARYCGIRAKKIAVPIKTRRFQDAKVN